MSDTYGTNEFLYKYVDGWPTLPDGMPFQECPGVAVDSRDNVFVLTRGEHPIMVFDSAGTLTRSFGEGLFSNRTHGLYIAHDDSLLVADELLCWMKAFVRCPRRASTACCVKHSWSAVGNPIRK